MPKRLSWLLVVPTVADVDERNDTLEELMSTSKGVIRCVSERLKKYQVPYYIANYACSSGPETYGGLWHLYRQAYNFTHLGKRIYLDLCTNHHSIEKICIIATESGAYLVMRVLQFFAAYGTKFQYDANEFDDKWSEFVFSMKLSPQANQGQNDILGLISSVVLIHPSLPSPSGIARLLGSLVDSGLYKHRESEPLIPIQCILLEINLKVHVLWVTTKIKTNHNVVMGSFPNSSECAEEDVVDYVVEDMKLV
ncbi:hypothetical protein VKT23_005127 [Stygiomarasmius scandens]|uniref:Uncharacterized protein n=1 Tax=Marasmiellus scandens TaxID=2682957 RepID=A0ABR1JS85_9AGAR